MNYLNQAMESYSDRQRPSGPSQYPPQGQAYPGAPQNHNNGLPPGWIQEWDAQDNRYFYINQNTGQRTFDRPSHPPSDPNHNLPPGWSAEWDAPDRRWFFVNQNTGERSWNPPQTTYTQVHTSGRGPMGSTYQQTEVISHAPPQKNHNLAYGAGGAVAGLAAGALLMHEGHKVEEHWETDKEKFEGDFQGGRDYRDESRGYSGGGETIVENQTFVDNRYGNDNERSYDDGLDNTTFVQSQTIINDDGYRRDDGFVDDAARWTGNKVQDVEDMPEDAARWTGDKVQDVQDFPEDAARWTGDKVQEVEDVPEDISQWVGDKVHGVEDFSENIEGSYDQGRGDRENYDDDRDKYDDDRENYDDDRY